MSKNSPSNGDKSGKSGYRPLNEGYSPLEKRGYVPASSGAKLPKAPTGGTGESSSASTNGANKTPRK